MSIIHRYILNLLIKNTILVIVLFSVLFLVIDFFDRIDNLVHADASWTASLQYFFYKIPLIFNLMLPLSFLVSTLLTLGLLSKNSELTAMRASGLSSFYLAKPIYVIGLVLSLFSLILNETIVPIANRRVKEIYNIDIQKKDETGAYSRLNFWWRDQERFLNIDMFDSRTNKMINLSILNLNNDFEVEKRVDAKEANWIGKNFGWELKKLKERQFTNGEQIYEKNKNVMPLTILEPPEEFYNAKTATESMSYSALRKFIKKQTDNGVKVTSLYSDLYQKFSFPFVTLIASFVGLTFAIRPARGSGLGLSFTAGLVIGFSYYIIHSYSMAMGRAEFIPAIVAAWMANIIMLVVGTLLHLGVDSPQQ